MSVPRRRSSTQLGPSFRPTVITVSRSSGSWMVIWYAAYPRRRHMFVALMVVAAEHPSTLRLW